ncbi:DUF3006 domain-containing protein [Thermomicrobium sp. 4228-Ro]|uniref:DUF3006 domain-containing protein n=1 Tax=Thermomicrobium sp. 4228-Ro TaxID=2993937 RepID=UPI002248B205|nr:DUF3006 domain-containing protein [Thermomicrobium sp. 4228-Ro]MCX2727249.1 DUF3006 domain-containing protein [Thermomicrobium sp. 4228-Ro]
MTGEYLIATVDRFEVDRDGQQLAVLVFDDGQQLVVPQSVVPWLRRGMVLRVRFERDVETEEARREAIQRLQEELFGDTER